MIRKINFPAAVIFALAVMVSWVDAQTWGPWSWSINPMICTTGVASAINQLANGGSGTPDSVVAADSSSLPFGIGFNRQLFQLSGCPTLHDTSVVKFYIRYNGSNVDSCYDTIRIVDVIPEITSLSGKCISDSTLIIHGTGFLTKASAKPVAWADFKTDSLPNSDGHRTDWDAITNMTYTSNGGVSGGGAIKNANQSGSYVAAVTSSGWAWNDYGKRHYLYRRVKRDFVTDFNWKTWRVNPGTGSTDIYIEPDNGNISVEAMDDQSGGYMQSNEYQRQGPLDTFNIEEILLSSNSCFYKLDGLFRYWMNGYLAGYLPYTDYMYHPIKLKGYSTGTMVQNCVVHGVIANATFPSDGDLWYDNVYIDTSWCRVFVGNRADYSQCTIRKEIQIPTSWSNTSINVKFRAGEFTTNDSGYVFVFNSGGVCNSVGYPLIVGSALSDTVYQAVGRVKR